MKNLFIVFMLLALAIFQVSSMAANKHGKSAQKAHAAEASASAATPVPTPVTPDPTWKTAIGAAVMAIGAGSLAARLGLDPAMLGLIGLLVILAVLVLMAVLLVRRRIRYRRNDAVYAGDYLNSIMPNYDPRFDPRVNSRKRKQRADHGKLRSVPDLPVGFDLPGLLSHAETCFIRLQQAWDRGKLGDIAEFIGEELLSELTEQLKKRGNAPNLTAVESLECVLTKLDCGSGDYLATVCFSGTIKEESYPAEPFQETWTMYATPASPDKWILVGIQQLS